MEKQRKKIWNKPSIDRFQMVCFSIDIVVRWNHISCNLFHRAFIKWTYCEKNYQNGKKMNIKKAKQRCTTVMQCQFIDKSHQCWGVFFYLNIIDYRRWYISTCYSMSDIVLCASTWFRQSAMCVCVCVWELLSFNDLEIHHGTLHLLRSIKIPHYLRNYNIIFGW